MVFHHCFLRELAIDLRLVQNTQRVPESYFWVSTQRMVITPMGLGVHLWPTDGAPLEDPTSYRYLVGSLVYLRITRPDISHPVHILSQFVSASTQLHYNHLLRVLRYLRGTITRRLFFPCYNSLQLQAYSDVTWANDHSDRRSLFSYCVFLGSSLIAWKTKKQTAVSCSSAEAELRAMASLTVEITWFRWLLEDSGVSVSTSTPLLSDSIGAISIARDPVKHEPTKHIGIGASYMRSQVQDQVIALHEQSQYKNPSNSNDWKRPPVEEVLCKLATHYVRVHSRQCTDEAEVAEFVVGLTSSLANCKFRKPLTWLSVHANGSIIPKDFIDKALAKKDTWLKSLIAIPKVQPRHALAILKKYRSMRSLLNVYMDPNKTVREKELLLQDLKLEDWLDDENRRFGEKCSRRVYRILMAQNGATKTDDAEK